MEDERKGAYRAIPEIQRSTLALVLGNPNSIIERILGEDVDSDQALYRIDQEMDGILEANPELAELIHNSVNSTYSAVAGEIRSEIIKSVLREVLYANAFAILGALDMELRRNSPS